MNLNELAKEVHKNAVEHGWWEEERSFGEIIALCHSELSEALEELRNGHKINEIYFKCKGCGASDKDYCIKCKDKKPEGIPIELADCVIRILDYFGKTNFKLSIHETFGIDQSPRTFPEYITLFHAYLSIAASYDYTTGKLYLNGLIKEIQKYCDIEKIDLEEAIKIKHEYNKTRPYKHGGKVI